MKTCLSCKCQILCSLVYILLYQPDKTYLTNNAVRIKDIEQLTGLTFLSQLERSPSARLRTFLPLELWPSPLVTPWEDLPCPLPDHASCPPGYVFLISYLHPWQPHDSNTLMYLTINHTHLHYYLWLKIHKCITLKMNLCSSIIMHCCRCTSTLYHP